MPGLWRSAADAVVSFVIMTLDCPARLWDTSCPRYVDETIHCCRIAEQDEIRRIVPDLLCPMRFPGCRLCAEQFQLNNFSPLCRLESPFLLKRSPGLPDWNLRPDLRSRRESFLRQQGRCHVRSNAFPEKRIFDPATECGNF